MNATPDATASKTMEILDHWQLSREEIVALLQLPERTRGRQLEHYRAGQALPDNAAVQVRVEHISGIADALRTSFPRNRAFGARWLVTPHRRFDNRTPLSLMLEDGEEGLCRVRAELDCAWSQTIAESESS